MLHRLRCKTDIAHHSDVYYQEGVSSYGQLNQIRSITYLNVRSDNCHRRIIFESVLWSTYMLLQLQGRYCSGVVLEHRAVHEDRQLSHSYVSSCCSPTATKPQMLWQEGKPSMPPVDHGALQNDRYERKRMDGITRAMSKVANIVSGSFVFLYH